MRNVNDAIRAAAKSGFEISIVPLAAHATYSADPLPLVRNPGAFARASIAEGGCRLLSDVTSSAA